MNQTDDQIDNQQQTIHRTLNIIRASLFFIIPACTVLAFQTGAWQLFMVAGFSVGYFITTLVCFRLLRQGRLNASIWVNVIYLLISAPLISAGIAGLGAVLALAVTLNVVQMAGPVLTQRYTGQLILFSIVSGLTTYLIDLFGLPTQFVSVRVHTFLTIILILLIVIFGYFFIRQFNEYHLRTKLVIAFVGIVLIAVSSVGVITIRTLRVTLQAEITQSLQQQSENFSDFVGAFFLEKVSQMQGLTVINLIKDILAVRNEQYTGSETEILTEIQEYHTQWHQVSDDDPLIQQIITSDETLNPIAHQLHDFSDLFETYTDLFITDQYGATVAATTRISDYYHADETWWLAAWNEGKGNIYLSDPLVDERSGHITSRIAIPIFNETGTEVIGILHSQVMLDQIMAIVDGKQIGSSGHAIILNREGEVLFESVNLNTPAQNLPVALRKQFATSGIHTEIITDEAGKDVVFAMSPTHVEGFRQGEGLEGSDSAETAIAQAVADLGWVLVLRQEANETFGLIQIVSQNMQIISLIVLGLSGLLGIIFAMIITQPIQALAAVATEIGSGNLDVPLPMGGNDAIGLLTTNFGYMTEQLKETLSELQQRTLIIETSAEVSRHLSTILDEQELMNAVVNQIKQGFNYYHAHIYLLDEKKNLLVMAGGTGQVGQQMLAKGHAVRPGEGLVGEAAVTGQIVLVSNVVQRPGWLPNPLLPDTKAEVAIPIVITGEVKGVLDVQHNVTNGLQQQDVDLLQLVANQVAVVLQNARLYTQAQRQADQQALINAIGQKIQSATTVERVLQIAAEELGQALGTQRTSVQLNSTVFDRNGR